MLYVSRICFYHVAVCFLLALLLPQTIEPIKLLSGRAYYFGAINKTRSYFV